MAFCEALREAIPARCSHYLGKRCGAGLAPVTRQCPQHHAPLEFGRQLRIGVAVGARGAAASRPGARRPRRAHPMRREFRPRISKRRRGPAERGAGGGGLGRAQRGAVHVVRAGLVRAALADHGLAAHQRRPAAVLAGLLQRRARSPRCHGRRRRGSRASRRPRSAAGVSSANQCFDVAVDADAVVVVDATSFDRPSVPASEQASWLMPSIRQPSPTNTQVR